MTSKDCVELTTKMALILSVDLDVDYVRTQSQHIIDSGRGENLEGWCTGFELDSLIKSTDEFKEFKLMCEKEYADRHERIITKGYDGPVFSFDHQYGRKLKEKVDTMKKHVILSLSL